ncbi:MAG: TIGR03943 family protein [Actinomycetota bacterium]
MTRSWSIARVAAGAALAAWAFVFWFVLLAGRSSLYLSPRVSWVVPVGAVMLTLAAAGKIASARTAQPEPLTRRDAVTLGLFTIPVVLLLALPPQTLGAYAVGRRPAFATGVSSSAEDIASGDLTLFEVAGAQSTRDGLDALQRRAGETVEWVGFVSRSASTPANELYLNRFIISCCVADAQGANIRIVNVPAGKFQENDWVRVEGTFYPLGRNIIVDADEVVGVPKPAQPYLSP